jgi:hypothetical protein
MWKQMQMFLTFVIISDRFMYNAVRPGTPRIYPVLDDACELKGFEVIFRNP